MKQNGVVFQAGPSLFFFTFPFENLKILSALLDPIQLPFNFEHSTNTF